MTRKTIAGIITFLEDDALHPGMVKWFTTSSPKATTTTEPYSEFETFFENPSTPEEDAEIFSTESTLVDFKPTAISQIDTETLAVVMTQAPVTSTSNAVAAITEIIDSTQPTILLPAATPCTDAESSKKVTLPNDGLIYFPLD